MIRKLLLTIALVFGFLFGNVELSRPTQTQATEQSAQPSAVKTYALRIAAALPNISIGTAAHATELNSDTTCSNSAAWMLDPSSPNLWTVSGGKCNGNSATNMQMLMQMNSAIKEGHKYRWQLDVSGRTTGILKVGVGLSMPTTPSFIPLTAPVTPIADTFTTSSGLHSVTALGTGDASPDVRSAFRMFSSSGRHKPVDPVVYPGQKGVSHLHRFFCNTAVTENSTYASLRATGMTTCGSTSPLYGINKSGYWLPDMLNGDGMGIQPNTINIYYKTFFGGSSLGGTGFCDPASPNFLGGAGGQCVNVPAALRMIMGYNTATGLGGPADGEPAVIAWQCWDWHTGSLTIKGPYRHLRDLFGSGSDPCPYNVNHSLNSMVGMFVSFPTCWDGSNLDSSNHRSHMAYAVIPGGSGWNKCDSAHPYMIPSIELQIYWEVDPNFVSGKWRLASDEMVSGAATDPGMTFHTDYMMAWSPTVLNQIMSTCWLTWNSCGAGDLGNGTAINGGDTLATSAQAGGAPDGHPLNVMRYDPTNNAGMGEPIRTNGTFSGEIIAAADGKFSLMAVADESGVGFNGQVDNVSLTDITSGHHGAVTVHMTANDNLPVANDNQLAEVEPIRFDLARAGH